MWRRAALLKECCQPSRLLCLIFEDLCGKRLAHAQCLVGREKKTADENGEICVVNPPASGIALSPTGQWMFEPRMIVVDGDRKTQTVRCQRVPAPRKPTWIVLNVEIDRPDDVLAILEPVGGGKGQEVILKLDASGYAAKDFGQPATFTLKLIDKTGGELLYTDVVQTEMETPFQAGGGLLPASWRETPAN